MRTFKHYGQIVKYRTVGRIVYYGVGIVFWQLVIFGHCYAAVLEVYSVHIEEEFFCYICAKILYFMMSVENIIAKQLLDIKAVILNSENPFTWASGWKSPIYCDNRKILSYSKARKLVSENLAKIVNENYADADVIAGVATGAIAWGIMVAEILDKPFAYVRPKPKNHGTKAQVEGDVPQGAKVVVIEDLISTGSSSLSAVDALVNHGAEVMGMVAIFSYNFDKARKAFENSNCELRTLTNYDTLIEQALECNYIDKSEITTLQEWRFRPDQWGGK